MNNRYFVPVDTNCRTTPSKDSPAVGYLGAGQQSTVVGSEPSGNWWLITNPKNPTQQCWVWSGSTTVSGDTSSLTNVAEGVASPTPWIGGLPSPTWTGGPPVVTPWPAAASPTFTVTPWPQQPAGPMTAQARFTQVGKCDNKEYAFFEVTNTSSLWFTSQDVTMLEHGTNRNLGQTRVPERAFLMAPLGCGGVTNLKAGSTGFINAKFSKQPAPGALVDASIRFCSEPNYSGNCTTVLAQFNYPGQASQPNQPEVLAMVVNFMNIHDCNNDFYAIFELVNNGNVAIKSADIKMSWRDNGQFLGGSTNNNGNFLSNKNDCLGNVASIQGGTNAFMRGYMGTVHPYKGRGVDAAVKMCSEPNLGGKCTSVTIPFTVP